MTSKLGYGLYKKIVALKSILCYTIYNEKDFSPGGHKRCALLQVQKAHDWSELQYRVHKQAWP